MASVNTLVSAIRVTRSNHVLESHDVFQPVKYRKLSPWHTELNPTDRCDRCIKPLFSAYFAEHKNGDSNLNHVPFAMLTPASHSTRFTPDYLALAADLFSRFDYVLGKDSQRVVSDSAKGEYSGEKRDPVAKELVIIFEKRQRAERQEKIQYDSSHCHLKFMLADNVLRRNPAVSNAAKGFAKAKALSWVVRFAIHKKSFVFHFMSGDVREGGCASESSSDYATNPHLL